MFIPLCVVQFGSEQIGREGSAAASSGMIGPGFVERTVAVLANTGVLSISIALSNIIIAIATTIIIVVIIIIIILLALDPRRRQVDEYPLTSPTTMPRGCTPAVAIVAREQYLPSLLLFCRFRSVHRLHCWLFVLILIKHVHRQEAVEQRVPIVWGNECRADQEGAEWQTNISY